MSFILETIQTPNKQYLDELFTQFEFSDHKSSECYEQNKSEEVEKNLLYNIKQRALDSKTRLHFLFDERNNKSKPCAVIALNFEMVGEFSALSIDLLFISKPYRGKLFNEIDTKISYFLLDFALQEAVQMNKISQLDAVILTAINKCVKEAYLEYGFEEFADDWLYILID
ncbi:MAG: hypothetical protein IE909_11595, partial [Campylobacterales bacterium]|nr:hypothetical protein [Campylobacterales bacterium]